tara:strand:+ start:7556 stop:7777 length:222 start_codon:yes stop_codon:yes gene_type:complete
MDTTTQRTLAHALYYLEASLKDMHYQASLQDVESFNMDTAGTPSFDSEAERSQYLANMHSFVNDFRALVRGDS